MNKKSKQSKNLNQWLIQKRQEFIGDDRFLPQSYLHLGHFLGYINNDDLIRGEIYSKLRRLVMKSHESQVFWTKPIFVERCSGHALNEESKVRIETAWRILRNFISLKQVSLLDWLTLDPVEYNLSKKFVQNKIRSAAQCLESLPRRIPRF